MFVKCIEDVKGSVRSKYYYYYAEKRTVSNEGEETTPSSIPSSAKILTNKPHLLFGGICSVYCVDVIFIYYILRVATTALKGAKCFLDRQEGMVLVLRMGRQAGGNGRHFFLSYIGNV